MTPFTATIPFTDERRADTGVTNVTMGIWLFLASEVMLFGALFSAYALLRVSATSWPHGRDVLDLNTALTGTFILVIATLTLRRARAATPAAARGGLAISALMALLFLALKLTEYRHHIAQGLLPSTSTFLATYYTLTGLHALHVACGLIANLWVAAGATRVSGARMAGRLRALSLYWTFVDIVWVIILVLMYLS